MWIKHIVYIILDMNKTCILCIYSYSLNVLKWIPAYKQIFVQTCSLYEYRYIYNIYIYIHIKCLWKCAYMNVHKDCIQGTRKVGNTYKSKKVKLATVVEGNQKAPFSIATTLRCRGGHYYFRWIAPLYPWYIPHNADC